jgi:hypothetical protein
MEHLEEVETGLRPDVLEQEHTNYPGSGSKKRKRGVIFQFYQDSCESMAHFRFLLQMPYLTNVSKSADVKCIKISNLQLSCKYFLFFWFNFKKVGGLIRNKPFNSFGFNALRQQHEWYNNTAIGADRASPFDMLRSGSERGRTGQRWEATRAP